MSALVKRFQLFVILLQPVQIFFCLLKQDHERFSLPATFWKSQASCADRTRNV